MVQHLDATLGANAPLVLLSIVHWGYSGYSHLWQQDLVANVYVEAGFPLERLEVILLDSTEIESARLQAFRALARKDTVPGGLSAARLEFVCRLATSFRDSTSTDTPVGDLLTGALKELASEALSNEGLRDLFDDSAVARSAAMLERGGRLSLDWRLAPTPPLELILNSSVPGKEITFTIVAAPGAVSIRTGFIRSIPDTIWAVTPSVFTINATARHVVVAAVSGAEFYGSFAYSWREGTIAGNSIEVRHEADTKPFAMTAQHLEITQ